MHSSLSGLNKKPQSHQNGRIGAGWIQVQLPTVANQAEPILYDQLFSSHTLLNVPNTLGIFWDILLLVSVFDLYFFWQIGDFAKDITAVIHM